MLALGLSAAAQNIIVTSSGDPIKAYNIEMAGNSVFYQTEEAENAPIQKINKADILIIKMQDGTKVDPNEAPKKEEAPAALNGNMLSLSGDVAAKNAELIADFNKVMTWEPDDKFYKKGQGKVGNGYAGIMWIDEGSQLYNGEVTISYQRLYDSGLTVGDKGPVSPYRSDSFNNPMVAVKVKNNTDKIIYLDLASSFVICGEDSSPYYVPVTTTVSNVNTTKSTSEYTNVKVEDDKIKSNDRTYVSGNTSTVTSVKEAQRYISVAPRATLTLDPMPICKSNLDRDSQMYNNFGNLYMSKRVFPFANTQYGQILDLEESDSPFTFGSCVTYSFDPEHSDLRSIRTELYLKYVMCTSSTALFPYTIEGNFHQRYPFWVPFYVTD